MYTLALVYFYFRTKSTVKMEALRSRKRVEYILIFFSISALTLGYLVKGMGKPAMVSRGMLSSIAGSVLPDVSFASSGLYTIGKLLATYLVFLLALRAKSQLQMS